MSRTDALAAYERPAASRTRPRSTGASRTCAGFDPDAFARRGQSRYESIDDHARPGRGRLRHGHRGRHRHLAGARGRPLRAAARGLRAAVLARRLGREVRGAQRGDVEERPARRRAEGRRAREAALRAHRGHGPDVLAARRRRGGRRARVADRGVRVAGDRHRGVLERGHRALRRAEREARVRVAAEPLDARRGTSRRTTRASSATRELDWVAGGFGSKQRQDAHPERPERPRRDLARDRRVLRRRRRSISTTTRSRSTSRRTARATSPSRARCATTRRRCGAG